MSDERDDNKAKGRRGKGTGLNSHTPTHMPQWVIEHARRVTEEALFNRPIPPEYRALFEEDEKD